MTTNDLTDGVDIVALDGAVVSVDGPPGRASDTSGGEPDGGGSDLGELDPRAFGESTAVDDIAFLTRSPRRVVALNALAERPLDRDDIQRKSGMSSSTVARLVREFEQRNWIRRNGHRYGTTQLGTFVAAQLATVVDKLETERQCRDIWEYLPGEDEGFTVELCTDATVTCAEPARPYCTVEQFVSFLSETDEFRLLGPEVALVEPCLDRVLRRLVDGTEVEVVARPSCAEYVRSTLSDRSTAFVRDDLAVLSHEELPDYGVGVFDDRVAIVCYDQRSGTVRALVDTPAPAAREWAESTYERYRRDARPLELERPAE